MIIWNLAEFWQNVAFFGTVAKFWSNSRPKLDRVTERARTRTSRPTTRTMATWSGKSGSLAFQGILLQSSPVRLQRFAWTVPTVPTVPGKTEKPDAVPEWRSTSAASDFLFHLSFHCWPDGHQWHVLMLREARMQPMTRMQREQQPKARNPQRDLWIHVCNRVNLKRGCHRSCPDMLYEGLVNNQHGPWANWLRSLASQVS